ncbi:galanin peptides-like [Lepisosteus oculatus]|uniref:galanin peptides-like n=1 Tax=Lepisosteus oculatus TaxID=7918 RepID=UPI0037191989
MQRGRAVLCVSLVLSGILSESLGLALTARDRRGWTLNSAGYLLGPHAHRTLTVKGDPAGKRDVLEENSHIQQPLEAQYNSATEDSVLQTVLDFISYLRLKELGALENVNVPYTSDEMRA